VTPIFRFVWKFLFVHNLQKHERSRRSRHGQNGDDADSEEQRHQSGGQLQVLAAAQGRRLLLQEPEAVADRADAAVLCDSDRLDWLHRHLCGGAVPASAGLSTDTCARRRSQAVDVSDRDGAVLLRVPGAGADHRQRRAGPLGRQAVSQDARARRLPTRTRDAVQRGDVVLLLDGLAATVPRDRPPAAAPHPVRRLRRLRLRRFPIFSRRLV
jgi:hypothetical protein